MLLRVHRKRLSWLFLWALLSVHTIQDSFCASAKTISYHLSSLEAAHECREISALVPQTYQTSFRGETSMGGLPEKENSPRRHWFSLEMTSEEWGSSSEIPYRWPCHDTHTVIVSDWLKICRNRLLLVHGSSVWDFCASRNTGDGAVSSKNVSCLYHVTEPTLN